MSVFSHPDYTVGPGTSPDHAPKEARGLYRRLGLRERAEAPSLHPTPKTNNIW